MEASRERILLEGDLPTPLNAPDGCPFSTRCPIFKLLPEDKQKVCTSEHPGMSREGDLDHEYACYFPDEEMAMLSATHPDEVVGVAGEETPWGEAEGASDAVSGDGSVLA